jgi:hypothetical protein
MKRDGQIGLSFVAFGLAFGLFGPSPAEAQTNKEFVRLLFTPAIIDPREEETPEKRAQVQQIAADSAEAIAKFIGLALSTAPVPSSSAGFAAVIDPSTKEWRVKSDSFGPTFADRPLTNGRGVFSIAFNFQYGRTDFEGGFDAADGREVGLPIFDNTRTFLDDGFVQFTTRRAFLQTTSRAFNFLASYGVTDRFDVGVLVPIVSLKLTGRIDDAFDRTRVWRPGQPGPTGILPVTTATSQSTTGLGDVTVRAKYSWAGERSEGLALGADLRLPSGSEEDLLGTGKASLKLQALLLKSGFGPASVHANAGVNVGGLSNEFNYVVGADTVVTSRATVAVSFLGRTVLSAALPSRFNTVQDLEPASGGLAESDIIVDRFIWSEEALTLLQVAAGVKLHVGGRWLIDASLLVPVNQRGFQPRLVPVIGLERTWR